MSTKQEFADFAQREYPRLVGSLVLYCGDGGLAEELAHDTLVRVRERWRTVRLADAPGAYAHRVAINLANSRFRRRSAERRALRRVQAMEPGGAAHLDPCGAEGVAVRRALLDLPDRQREVLVRRYYLDQATAEVAVAMGITEGTVASTTHRALEGLRRSLGVSTGEGSGASTHDLLKGATDA